MFKENGIIDDKWSTVIPTKGVSRVTIGRNIRRLREQHGITQEELGKIAGVGVTAVSNWENDVSDPLIGRVELIAAHFGIPKSAILDDRSVSIAPSPSPTTAPLVGDIAAGEPAEAIARDGERAWVDPDVLSAHPRGFFLHVRGDSMNRVLPEGSLAFVDPATQVAPGDIAAVNVNGDDATIKRLFRAGDTIVLHPESTNPEHRDRALDARDPDAPRVRIIGKVVWLTFPADVRL